MILHLTTSVGDSIYVNLNNVLWFVSSDRGGTLIIMRDSKSMSVNNDITSILAQIPEEWGKK